MDEFEKNGYVIVRNVLNPQSVNLLCIQFKMLRDSLMVINGFDINDNILEILNFHDGLCKKAFCYYGAQCFDSLLILLQDKVECIVGKKLIPSHSNSRIMYNGTSMIKHKDRSACEYTVSICIEEDGNHPYPLMIKDYDGKTVEINLSPGDMVVMKGTELEHWREPYKGNRHIQTFLSYVSENGEQTKWKYDSRPALGLREKWKTLNK